MPASPGRAELLAMLTTLGDRHPEQVPENLDSMELAWLIHQVEERYGLRVDLDDAAVARITSVTAAEQVLRELVFEAADDASSRLTAAKDRVAGHALRPVTRSTAAIKARLTSKSPDD
jgi:hypothetical protein